MAGADPAFGQRTSDLVLDSKLQTTFHNNYTKHVIDVAGPNVHQRRTTQEQRWRRRKPLGRGTFGEVWLEELSAGQSSVTQRAVKIIGRHTSVDYSRELEAFAKFSHRKYARCFVESFGWYQNENSVFITMEYIPLGDLQDYMSATFLETEVQQISYQLLEGLSFMHENGFAHRDLKPGNVLVRSTSPNWWVKIGDFGISKRAEEGMTELRTNSGTRGFMAPEVYAQEGLLDFDNIGELRGYTVAVDLWSLGEIIFRAFTKEPPFARNLAAYVAGRAQFPSTQLQNCGVSDDGCDFITGLMKPNPKDRLTALGGLRHRWVATQKPESPRSSDELQRSAESPNNYGWCEPADGSEVAFEEPSNAWSTINVAAPVSNSSAHMAYSTAYRTAIKQEPESSHHTRYLPIQETQDQQDVVTASLNHRASIEPGYVSRKPEPETSHPTSYLPKRKTQNQQDGVTTNFNPRPSIGPRYIPRKQDETTEIVVGIALGASFSEVSWAVNHGSKPIRVINVWPDPHSTVRTSDRVPTVISYQNGEPAQWGFMIDSLREDSFRFIELLLDPKHHVSQISKAALASIKLPGTMNKTVGDVATDYIRKIWNYTKEDIQKTLGDTWESLHTLRLVVTLPANWPLEVNDIILDAACKAGNQYMVQILTEPKAAALAVLQENENLVLKTEDSFLVCHAGSTTVDLIGYKIVSLDLLAFVKCAPQSEGLCGSTYLSRAFEELIRATVGEDQWQQSKDRSKRRMIKDFELSIARSWEGDNQQYSIDFVRVGNDPQSSMYSDTITLESFELNRVFDYAVDQIIKLLDEQINRVQNRGNKVKVILLVGDFVLCPYMYSKLRDAHKASDIQVIQSNRPASLNCRGATWWGLTNPEPNWPLTETVRGYTARFSYGVENRGRMLWLIKKGNVMEVGKIERLQLDVSFKLDLFSIGTLNLEEQIYFCDDDDPPYKREMSVKELYTFFYTIKHSKLRHEPSYRHLVTGKKHRNFKVDLLFEFKGDAVDFKVMYKGQELSHKGFYYDKIYGHLAP